jgi:ketosteroid isomerase-like protein
MKTKLLLPIALLGLSAMQVAGAACSATDVKALEALDRAWGAASESGDQVALEKIYADDFLDLAMDAAGKDRAQTLAETMEEAAASRGKPATEKTVPDHYAIHCTANTAIITHRNVITGTGEDGKTWTEYRRSVHLLEKRKGAWQVVSNAGHRLGDMGQLYYMEQDWNAADVNNDVAWFERNLAYDYSSVSSRTGALSDKAEDIADVRSPKRKMTSAVLSDFNVRVSGDSAVVTGVNHVTGTDDKNQPIDRRVRFTDTFVKRDGRWQAWATQGTTIADTPKK